ncbi:Aminoglycoside phosphotransferase [Penicillium expansum]|uniref:Aminoglycoside phosphotransferase n=1 Tax=Penicillium expansum TaxID=27334 RepID=A0A0A2JK37_PENEN|nr:Aminoglycoside phosphotransferase [Penicillium expansum]KGO39904.1 Aminoglycoside phosphotransferase [Penicillium expansum]KGO55053.1 Aminoglycoside phosphotransferase [Penicillium expansum]KGO56592.1 Aminoglycoside phosphotransferase [Penicillium expansum]
MQITPDDLLWEQAEDISHEWLKQFLGHDIWISIAGFMLAHNRGVGNEIDILKKGSYNISLWLKYENEATVIRLSQPGAVMFPEEKVVNEVAVMRFLTDQTLINIPFILHSGTKKESPLELGSFIMMEYIEHKTKIYAALNTPGCPAEERGVLDPDIDEARLELLYGQLAGILLQLSATSFPRIGSLGQIDEFTWDVTRRPLTINMNELVRIGGLPQSKLPYLNATFDTSSSYMEALADINIEHLVHQRNDSVDSADDCRRKFVARQLFRKLAREKKLTNPLLEKGPFKIWCDDLRPANVLLNENPTQIAGVVDWEFTYAAPVEFSYAPPWWLLIEKPEFWPGGIEDWTRVFEHRLKTSFLKAMKDCEDTAIQQGRLREDQRLSGPIFAFDENYWQKIDPRFFGPTKDIEGAWKQRLGLLDEQEKEEMELLVARKLMEMETRTLSWDPDEYTLAFREQLKSQEKAKVENNLEESMDSEPSHDGTK